MPKSSGQYYDVDVRFTVQGKNENDAENNLEILLKDYLNTPAGVGEAENNITNKSLHIDSWATHNWEARDDLPNFVASLVDKLVYYGRKLDAKKGFRGSLGI